MRDYEFYVVDAKSPSGSTAALEVIQGKQKLADRVYELESSDHTVRVYRTALVNHEVYTKVTDIEFYE